jgi:hypothetical protein
MKLAFLVLFVSSIALADVGPRPPRCNVPEGCVTCSGEQECVAQAVDGGLIESECSDRTGSVEHRYFCPKGKTATRGCSSVDVLGLSAVAALMLRRRRGR